MGSLPEHQPRGFQATWREAELLEGSFVFCCKVRLSEDPTTGGSEMIGNGQSALFLSPLVGWEEGTLSQVPLVGKKVFCHRYGRTAFIASVQGCLYIPFLPPWKGYEQGVCSSTFASGHDHLRLGGHRGRRGRRGLPGLRAPGLRGAGRGRVRAALPEGPFVCHPLRRGSHLSHLLNTRVDEGSGQSPCHK